MPRRTIRAEDIEAGDFVKLLRQVAKRRVSVTIILPGEEAVTIGPASSLRPLPELDGLVPEGWKDAIYES
jgi:hypothetical protein